MEYVIIDYMLIKISPLASCALLLTCFITTSCTPNDRNVADTKLLDVKYPIEYRLTDEHWMEGRELTAIIQTKEYKLVGYDESSCIDTVKTADFNKNGFQDVLVEYITGCGANCCANNYQIFSFDGKRFRSTERVGYDWDGVEIAESPSGYSFIIKTSYEGFARTELCEDVVGTYQLEGYDLILKSSIKEGRLSFEVPAM